MFHSCRLNNKINSINERAQKVTYQDNKSTFQELLNKDNSVSIHHRNLQVLATEMFKIHRSLFPEILRETDTILLTNVKCTLYITALDCSRV